MELTNVEQNMLSEVSAGETISKPAATMLHGLLFSGGGTIANIEHITDIIYKGRKETITVRDWNEKKFQIVHGISSAVYPPKAHLKDIIKGVDSTISSLERKEKEYKIVIQVPVARQLVFPEKYVFSHDTDWHDTLKGYVPENRTKIRDWYLHKNEWNVGSKFGNCYTVPEDIRFLEKFSSALEELTN